MCDLAAVLVGAEVGGHRVVWHGPQSFSFHVASHQVSIEGVLIVQGDAKLGA